MSMAINDIGLLAQLPPPQPQPTNDDGAPKPGTYGQSADLLGTPISVDRLDDRPQSTPSSFTPQADRSAPPRFTIDTRFRNGGENNRQGGIPGEDTGRQDIVVGYELSDQWKLRTEFGFPTPTLNSAAFNVLDNPSDPTELDATPRIRTGVQYQVTEGVNLAALLQRNADEGQVLRLEANGTFAVDAKTTGTASFAFNTPLRENRNGLTPPPVLEFTGTVTHKASDRIELGAIVSDYYFPDSGDHALRVGGSIKWKLDDAGTEQLAFNGHFVTSTLGEDSSGLRGELSYLNTGNETFKAYGYLGAAAFSEGTQQFYGGVQLESDTELAGQPFEFRAQLDWINVANGI